MKPEEENIRCELQSLICGVLYCREEAHILRLDLVEYLLDMARLELELKLGAIAPMTIPASSSGDNSASRA
jgi:hypothetical protein